MNPLGQFENVTITGDPGVDGGRIKWSGLGKMSSTSLCSQFGAKATFKLEMWPLLDTSK